MKIVESIVTTRRLARKRTSVSCCALSALLVIVASCGGGDADGPPSDSDVDRAVRAIERAAQEQDARLALACDLGDVEEVAWRTEERAVISSPVDDAVDHVLRDEIWSSFELPSGRREIGHGTVVPVLVDRGGYTIAGAAKCR